MKFLVALTPYSCFECLYDLPGDICLLPLSPQSYLRALRSDFRVVRGGPRLDLSEETQLQLRVTDLIARNIESASVDPQLTDTYLLSVIASNQIYWEMSIEANSKKGAFDAFVHAACGDFAACTGSQLDLMLSLTLSSLLSDHEILSADRFIHGSSKEGSLRHSIGALANDHGQKLLDAFVQNLSSRSSTAVNPKSWSNTRALVGKHLLVAQGGKVQKWIRTSRARSDITLIDYDQIVDSAESNANLVNSLIPLPSSTDGLLRAYAQASAQTSASVLRDWGRSGKIQGGSSILFDAPYQAGSYQLMRLAERKGVNVAFLPEGCTTYSGQSEPFGRHVTVCDQAITRFVVDSDEYERWKKKPECQKSVRISGYLGYSSSVRPIPASVKALWQLRRFVYRSSTGRKKIVFLSVDVLAKVSNKGRFGQPAYIETIDDVQAIAESILDDGCVLVCKAKDAEVANFLKMQFAGQRFFCFVDTPWALLAMLSDVSITRQSSIGWEAEQIGLPVALYNFHNYPSNYEADGRLRAPVFGTPGAITQHVLESPARKNRLWRFLVELVRERRKKNLIVDDWLGESN